MLRRTAVSAMLRRTPLVAAGGLFSATGVAKYRYNEFEMSKAAAFTYYYPREAPNTSYFPQWQIGFWVFWGWGREDLWMDRDERRYQTFWQLGRKLLMVMFPAFYFFPVGMPLVWAQQLYGPYGEKSHLPEATRHPFDNAFLERNGSGYTLDPEWIRHIHSKDSF